jgi:hypothetical protein
MTDRIITWVFDHQGAAALVVILGYSALLWEFGLLEG